MQITLVSVASDLSLGVVKCHVRVSKDVAGVNCSSDTVALIGWTKGEAVDTLNTFITSTKLSAVMEFQSRFLSEEASVPPVKRGKKTATTSAAPSSPLVVETVTSDSVAEEKTETQEVILEPVVSPVEGISPAPVPAVIDPVESPVSRVQETPITPEIPVTTEIYVRGQPQHAAIARDAFTIALVSIEGPDAQSWGATSRYKAAAAKAVQFLLDEKVVVLVNGEANPQLSDLMYPVVKAALG